MFKLTIVGLKYYINLIREETVRTVDELPMAEKQDIQRLAAETDGYWGYFWRELKFPAGPDFDNMTIAQAAAKEINTIDAILRRAIERRDRQASGYKTAGEQLRIGYH